MNGARYGRRLSPREREILGALAEGEKLSEIARRLCIEPSTAHAHALNIRIKLGVRTMAAATFAYATRYRSDV